jgi:hypothetical protein
MGFGYYAARGEMTALRAESRGPRPGKVKIGAKKYAGRHEGVDRFTGVPLSEERSEY